MQLSELDGLIITEIPPETLEFITTLNKKFVFVDNYIDGYCNIGYNTVYANQLIFDHIIKCGYKKDRLHRRRFQLIRPIRLRLLLPHDDLP